MTSVMVLLTSGVGYALFRHFDGNINRMNVFGALGAAPRPAKAPTEALNFLVVGSDTRSGAGDATNPGDAAVTGARSDTTILVHLSANRDKALLVSLPRDSVVSIPTCTDPATGGVVKAHVGQFNSAFSVGGAPCTISTVEAATDLRIDHYVQVDFAGFKNMVAALGGVPICLPTAVKDTNNTVNLPAGRTVLQGDQALGFVRARYGLGDGSDLGRIERQKQFLASMVNKATSAGVLLRPDRLLSFLGAVTGSITVDQNLSFNDMKDLGLSLRGLDPARVAFVTVPLDASPGRDYDRGGKFFGRVKWDAAGSTRLFDSLRNDGAVPGPTSPPTVASDLTVSPKGIKVEVLNGFGGRSAASDAATALTGVGFTVSSTGNADASTYRQTVVRFGPSKADSARTLAAAIPGSVLQADASLGSTLRVIVGPDFPTTLVTPTIGTAPAATPSAAPGGSAVPALPTTTAADNVCA